MGNLNFKESQRFRKLWIWLVLLLAIGIWGYNRFTMLNDFISNRLFIEVIVIVLIVGFILSTNLNTIIDQQGVKVKFFPFHFNWKVYKWNEIEDIGIRTYSPLREFGGFGLRFNLNGKAYNVAGNKGIQIKFKSGKKLLIGTQKHQQAGEIIRELTLNTV